MRQGRLTRERRTDANGEPVVVYFRDATYATVYRFADSVTPYWLYNGSNDRQLGQFATVAELEEHVKRLL